MKLLIIRHAESMANATGDYSIAAHDTLSPEGKHQANAIVPFLQSQIIDQVIVSTLDRTQETIAPYLEATKRQAEIWPEISEACWHEEREKMSDSWKPQPAVLSPELKHLFNFKNGEAIKPDGLEPYGEGIRRIHTAVELIQDISQNSNDTLLMVTHGHFIREFIKLIFGTSNNVDFHQDNCGTTLLSYSNNWTMQYCNRSILQN